VDSIEYREYQINGMSKENIYCYLRYKIFKGEIQNPDTDILKKVNVLRIEDINDINVNEDFQRQGIGTKMYQLLSAI
jgi:ribosomal protein S18 acetylase RimI-like enzyme